MTLLELLIVAIASIAVLLLAISLYGAWLIGQDTEAERGARDQAGSVPLGNTGFALIDAARTARLPYPLNRIEDWLGWRESRAEARQEERAQHRGQQ